MVRAVRKESVLEGREHGGVQPDRLQLRTRPQVTLCITVDHLFLRNTLSVKCKKD